MSRFKANVRERFVIRGLAFQNYVGSQPSTTSVSILQAGPQRVRYLAILHAPPSEKQKEGERIAKQQTLFCF
jgi:hypothetical protein